MAPLEVAGSVPARLQDHEERKRFQEPSLIEGSGEWPRAEPLRRVIGPAALPGPISTSNSVRSPPRPAKPPVHAQKWIDHPLPSPRNGVKPYLRILKS